MKQLFGFLFGLLLCVPAALSGSSIDGQKVSFRRLMEELTNDVVDLPAENSVGYPVSYHSKKDFVILRNVEVVFDRAEDNDLDKRFVTNGPPIIVRKGVEFNNCIFPSAYWYLLRNVVFEDIVGFRSCQSLQGIFKGCTFKHHLYIYSSQLEFFDFDSCTFHHGMEITASKVSDHLSFTNCVFSQNPEWVQNPRVNEAQNVIKNLPPVPPFFELLNRVDPFDLSFDRCIFHLDKGLPNRRSAKINLGNSAFNSFNFTHNTTNVPLDLSFTAVDNQLSIHDCNLEGNILAEAFNFNTSNAKVEWQSLAGDKIAIYDPEQNLMLHGGNINQFRSNFGFNTLISTYALFYSSYRDQGNRLSANACYNEWKDVETAYLAYLYEKDPDFQVYFQWLMNVFLKTFCDYGTNPVKSMIWSFWVLLTFGLFYFFFPRHCGIQSRISIPLRMQNYAKWFTEGKSLVSILEDHHDEENYLDEERDKFLQFLKEHKKTLPAYFNVGGWRWIRVDSLYFRFQKAIYGSFDNTLGKWRIQSTLKRLTATMGFSLILLAHVVTQLAIHLLDAFTNSLNAFTQLGFGEIPFQGMAKYMAVLEGFVGWFLLSIFSVALISQIIQ
jgi:hypothetical protein